MCKKLLCCDYIIEGELFLSSRISTTHLTSSLVSIVKLPALYMQLSEAMALRNILDKLEDSSKRYSVFTGKVLGNQKIKK